MNPRSLQALPPAVSQAFRRVRFSTFRLTVTNSPHDVLGGLCYSHTNCFDLGQRMEKKGTKMFRGRRKERGFVSSLEEI